MADAYLPPVVTRLEMDIKDFLAKVAAAKAALDDLAGKPVEFKVDADTGPAAAKVAALREEMTALGKAADDAIDPEPIKVALQTINEMQAETRRSWMDTVDVISQASIAMANADETLADSGFFPRVREMTRDVSDLRRDLEDLASTEATLARGMELGGNALERTLIREKAVAELAADIARTDAAARRDAEKAAKEAAAAPPTWLENLLGTGKANPVFSGGGLWGLGGTTMLWGGAAGVGTLHLALDGLFESVVALGSALADLALGAAAAAPAARDIYTHLQAVQAVSSALGTSIPPLTGKFEDLSKNIAPQVIEAYGGALGLVNHQLAGTGPIVTQVINGFDSWIAKLDLFMGSQKSSNLILGAGLGFLHQFEQVTNNVGVALSKLIRADPGTAHYLMDVVVGITKVFESFASLPAPIVRTILAFHSFFLWGGLLFTLTGRIAGAVWSMATKIGAAFAFMAAAENFAFLGIAALGVIAAAIIYLQHRAEQATPAVANLMNHINASMSSDNAGTAISDIGMYIDQIGHKLPAAWKTASGAAVDYQHLIPNAIDAALHGNTDAADLGFKLADLIKDHTKILTAGIYGVKQYGLTWQQSLAAMDLAGVKAGDSLALMKQKVDNLLQGYKALSVSGGLLRNSVNAITFAADFQNSKVQQITQSYSAFIGMITGGQSAFSTFQQQVTGIATAAGDVSTALTVANGKVSVSTKAAAGAAQVSINGLGTASLQLQSAFTTGVTDASNLMNQLYDLNAAAGMGQRGMALLTQGGKDLVAELLPAAHGSQMATTEIYALAQTAGYQGANSFQQLAKWVGNVRNPAKNLDSVLTTLTVHAGNLAQDVANLSNAINPQMTSAFDAAIVKAGGGQKAFNDFAAAFANGQGKATQMTTAAREMAKELTTVYGNTSQARTMFESFAAMLGISQSAADRLWSDLVSGSARSRTRVTQDIQAIHDQLNGIQDKTISITVVEHAIGINTSAPGVSFGPAAATQSAALTPNITRVTASGTTGATVHEIHVHLDGREIFRGVQTQAVNRQRRTGSNGLERRSR